MSFPTSPAYVHRGSWSKESDQVPPMKFQHEYTTLFDQGKIFDDFDKWHTPDYQYVKADGTIFAKGAESRDGLKQDYAFFTKWRHEPYFGTMWKHEDGSVWELNGNAWLFANLPNGSGSGSHKDEHGEAWDIKIPAGFHFVYKIEGDSMKIQSSAITSDTGPVVMELLKRGVLKPADLGL